MHIFLPASVTKMIEPDMDIGLPHDMDKRKWQNRIHAKTSRQRRLDYIQTLKDNLQQIREENKRLIQLVGHDIPYERIPTVPFKPRPRRTDKPSSNTPGLSPEEIHRAKNRESAERSRFKREAAAHRLKVDIVREKVKHERLVESLTKKGPVLET